MFIHRGDKKVERVEKVETYYKDKIINSFIVVLYNTFNDIKSRSKVERF